MSCYHGQDAMSMLYLTILLNLWFQQEPAFLADMLVSRDSSSWWGFDWHSHSYTTAKSMLISMFTHADWEHLWSNMFLLWIVGRQIFVPTYTEEFRRREGGKLRLLSCWTSPLCFLWIYAGSQIMSFAGCRFISYLLDQEWERRVRQDRTKWSWQWVPNGVRDFWYTVSNAQQAIELRVWQLTPMIGSSAAVFGVVGAHVFAALCVADHPAKMDSKAQFIWLIKIGMELARTPFSLDQISSLDIEDNIDHASHFCGFLGGVLLAATWGILSRRQRGQEREYLF